ncbi:hypothetical protein QN277_012052 [Acacia crassicarpa]|uniref:DUF3741 domain-containing protein n=1 Tax=Acacia crassicarpa TaxID=499986 RepID=A0AAE1MZM1_9FABA|nr:hypothetical protein QN277_012052 [Acacia crassicarpa]
MAKEGGRSLKRAEPETPSGCISSFFHLFDFHPFHFSFQHHHPQPSFNADHTTTTIPKGTEAPRNSLESVDSTMVVGSISKAENLEVPKNKLFIKTSTTGKVGNVVNDLAPGTKTPTLVARLMGLDLLPEIQSPSSSSPSSSSATTTTSSSCPSATKSQVNPRHHNHNHHHHHYLRPRQNNNVVITKARHSMDDSIAASHFLPETPRISSARRSDVEHRLSLQINKENMQDFLELPRFSFSNLKFEEQQGNSKSPRHYAKQIVKQVRESVLSSRKVGSDVTNTVKNNNREKKQEGGEFLVVGQFKRSKKSPKTKPTCSSSSSDELINSPEKVLNNNPPSCSPRLRFMDSRKDQNSPQAKPRPQEAIILVQQQEQVHQIQKQKKSASSVPMCNRKAANEKFRARLKKQDKFVRNKKEGELFVRPLLSSSNIKSSTGNKSKRSSHPLLINLLNLNTVIDSNTAPTAIKIPQKQVLCVAREEVKYCSSQLSSGSSQTYTKETTTSSCVLSTTTTGESNVAELDKLKKGTTTANSTTVMAVSLFHQWLYPTQQAVDPSIFHHLEQWYHSQSQNENQNPTCDIFSVSSQDRDLMPNNKYDMGIRCNRRLLFDLVNETLLKLEVNVGTCYNEEAVWESINGTFDKSNKKCEVLEDIDALIDMEDMGKKRMKKKSEEAMVAEIEGNIMDTLLHETVMVVTECCC